MTKLKIMNVVERAKAPTPKFFKVLRTIGLALLAVSGSIIAAPVASPARSIVTGKQIGRAHV